jgi:WD40 repeat protein/serine/threonine protein kinase
MSDNDPSAADPFGQIADEFVEAFRQGQRPSVEEFAQRYPAHADEIRDMLPALVLMEQAKTADDSPGHERQAKASAVAMPLRQLGDYQLLREVGRGGMGVVYEAQQLSLGRHVAIKVLPPHALLDPRHLQRFQREARSAARLHHTNIVPVFGVGEHDGLHYYVMQFIPGLGLDVVLDELRRLRQPRGKPAPTPGIAPGRPTNGSRDISAVAVARGLLTGEFRPPEPAGALTTPAAEPGAGADLGASSSVRAADPSATIHLPGQSEGSTLSESGRQYWQSVARIGLQVADALAHAASQGVLHRDIKPSNLLLDDTGNVWVTDFGLAKADTDGDNLTHTGDIVGTLRYMAPERFNGRGDVRSDVYSLGLTLYELLVLRRAFDEADRSKLVKQVMHDEPVRPRKLNPSVPRDLETVVLKAIARDPAHRYQTPAEMADDLKRFVEDRPVRARRVSGAEKVWRWCRRNPGVALLLGAVAASLLLGMATTSYYAIQASNREQDALANARLAQEEKARSDRRWYAAEMNLAEKAWEEAQIPTLRQRLAAFEPQGPDAPDLRGFEWYYLQRVCRLDLLTLPAHAAPVRSVAYSPDGRRLASASGAYNQPGEVKVWDTMTGRELLCLRGHPDLVSCVAFSPDGQRLAAANGGVYTPGEIKIWSAADGRELLGFRAHATPVRGLAFSPDGRRLASAGGGFDRGGMSLPGEVKVWDAADGRELLRVPGRAATRWDAAVNAVAFSPDGRRLAFADGRTVRVCDAATGSEALAPGKQQGSANSVAYSPDGRHLASSSVEGTVKVWDTGTGQETLAFHHAAGIWSLAFSPDGQRLAAAAGNSTVKVWDLTAGKEALVLRGHTETVSAVAFSPDGWRLASGCGDGAVKIWDATTPAEAVTLGVGLATIQDVAFSPDGRRLAVASTNATVRVLDTITAVEVLTLYGHAGTVSRVAYSPDGRRLASGGEDRTVRVWDATNGAEIFCLRGYTAPIQGLAFSPDGRRLATASGGLDKAGRPLSGEIKVWNVSGGEEVLTLPGHAELANTGAFTSVALSPEGERLAAGAGRAVCVWDAATGRRLLTLSGHDGPVLRVAYTPDGRQLASASRDRLVKVWDTATGEELLTLHGHTSGVSGLAYSPDGRRLVSTAGGATRGGERIEDGVKIWDARVGQEVLTLHGATGQSPCLTFAPDGRRLAAGGDIGVTIWEAAPLAAELHEPRQAISLVKFLFDQSLTREAVLARIRDDHTIRDPLRQQALTLVEPIGQSRVRQKAENEVRSLFRKPLFRSEVRAQLRAETALSEPVRQEALALAERFVEFPYHLDRASRAVASRAGAEPSAYRLAVQRAEIACRLMPFEGPYHTTLGMAQYRLGDYQQALATLTRADELNRAAQGSPVPADLALLAMTRYQLRDKERAQASLAQLRETMQQSNWARNEEAQGLRKEAEGLLAG